MYVIWKGTQNATGEDDVVCESAASHADCDCPSLSVLRCSGGVSRCLRVADVVAEVNSAAASPQPACTGGAGCGAGGTCDPVTGRCKCQVDTTSGATWGGPRCEIDNSASNDWLDSFNQDYGSDKYKTYYNDLVNNASKLVLRPEDVPRDGNAIPDGDTSASGQGSTMFATFGIRVSLPRLIKLLGVKTIVDVPCGDFHWMQTIINSPMVRALNVSYVGGDVVSPLVAALNRVFGDLGRVDFVAFDIAAHIMWPADLVVVRDVLFHFDAARVMRVLRNINKSGATWLLTTYFPTTLNADSVKTFRPGSGFYSFWRINLEDKPFNLPPPVLAIGRDGGKHNDEHKQRVMGLWRLPLPLPPA